MKIWTDTCSLLKPCGLPSDGVNIWPSDDISKHCIVDCPIHEPNPCQTPQSRGRTFEYYTILFAWILMTCTQPGGGGTHWSMEILLGHCLFLPKSCCQWYEYLNCLPALAHTDLPVSTDTDAGWLVGCQSGPAVSMLSGRAPFCRRTSNLNELSNSSL